MALLGSRELPAGRLEPHVTIFLTCSSYPKRLILGSQPSQDLPGAAVPLVSRFIPVVEAVTLEGSLTSPSFAIHPSRHTQGPSNNNLLTTHWPDPSSICPKHSALSQMPLRAVSSALWVLHSTASAAFLHVPCPSRTVFRQLCLGLCVPARPLFPGGKQAPRHALVKNRTPEPSALGEDFSLASPCRGTCSKLDQFGLLSGKHGTETALSPLGCGDDSTKQEMPQGRARDLCTACISHI